VQTFRNSLEKRGFAFLLPLGLLMLAMAVFAWGLQYKLSLYHPSKNAVAHSAPEAKLLSEKERPIVVQALDSQAPQLPPFTFVPALLMLVMSAGLHQVAVRSSRSGSAQRVPIPLPRFFPALFFRPPPIR
jgi:hypothetical protein